MAAASEAMHLCFRQCRSESVKVLPSKCSELPGKSAQGAPGHAWDGRGLTQGWQAKGTERQLYQPRALSPASDRDRCRSPVRGTWLGTVRRPLRSKNSSVFEQGFEHQSSKCSYKLGVEVVGQGRNQRFTKVYELPQITHPMRI